MQQTGLEFGVLIRRAMMVTSMFASCMSFLSFCFLFTCVSVKLSILHRFLNFFVIEFYFSYLMTLNLSGTLSPQLGSLSHLMIMWVFSFSKMFLNTNACIRRINGNVLYEANIFIVLCLKGFHVEQSDWHNTKGNWTNYIIETLVRTLPKKMNY